MRQCRYRRDNMMVLVTFIVGDRSGVEDEDKTPSRTHDVLWHLAVRSHHLLAIFLSLTMLIEITTYRHE